MVADPQNRPRREVTKMLKCNHPRVDTDFSNYPHWVNELTIMKTTGLVDMTLHSDEVANTGCAALN